MSIDVCTCGHRDLAANFHLTPCPIKVRLLERLAEQRRREAEMARTP